MTTEIQIEISMLAYAFVLGVLLRLVCLGLELLRRFVLRGRICSVCLDAFYWAAAAGAVYRLMYRYASGTLRGIVIVFVLTGLVFMTAIDRKIGEKLKNVSKTVENKEKGSYNAVRLLNQEFSFQLRNSSTEKEHAWQCALFESGIERDT